MYVFVGITSLLIFLNFNLSLTLDFLDIRKKSKMAAVIKEESPSMDTGTDCLKDTLDETSFCRSSSDKTEGK